MTGQINVNKIAARSGTTITVDTGDALDVTLVKGEGTATTNLKQGLNKVWFTLGVDAVQDKSFNCSSVDDDGTGDYGIHFTNDFSDALYSSSIGMTVDALNDRYMVQSPSKAAGAVEVRLMSTNNGVDTESNITHAEMQICGDLA